MTRFAFPSLPPIEEKFVISAAQWDAIEEEIPCKIPDFHRKFVEKSCFRFKFHFENEQEQPAFKDVEKHMKDVRDAVRGLYQTLDDLKGNLEDQAAFQAHCLINIHLKGETLWEYPDRLDPLLEAVNIAYEKLPNYKVGGRGRDKLVSPLLDKFIYELGEYFQDLGGRVTANWNKHKNEYDGPFIRFVFAVLKCLPAEMRIDDKNILGNRIRGVVKPRGISRVEYYA